MEELVLDSGSMTLFIEWVSREYPSFAPGYVSFATKMIEEGRTMKFRELIHEFEEHASSPTTHISEKSTSVETVIDEDTKITSENYAIVLEYMKNMYEGEQFEIMEELVQDQIVKDGTYFEVSYLEACSTDILNKRRKDREETRMRRIKPTSIEERRTLFAQAALSRKTTNTSPI